MFENNTVSFIAVRGASVNVFRLSTAKTLVLPKALQILRCKQIPPCDNGGILLFYNESQDGTKRVLRSRQLLQASSLLLQLRP